MQPVLCVCEMAVGNEVAVREIHDRFPAGALAGRGAVERLMMFIGSGYYALEITVGDGDFQEHFHGFLETPKIRELFAALAAHVRNLPVSGQGTAEMPLATAMLLWQRQGSADATTV